MSMEKIAERIKESSKEYKDLNVETMNKRELQYYLNKSIDFIKTMEKIGTWLEDELQKSTDMNDNLVSEYKKLLSFSQDLNNLNAELIDNKIRLEHYIDNKGHFAYMTNVNKPNIIQ